MLAYRHAHLGRWMNAHPARSFTIRLKSKTKSALPQSTACLRVTAKANSQEQSHIDVISYNIEIKTWAKRKQRFTKVHWSVLCEIREILRSSMNPSIKQPMNIVRNAYLKDLIAPSRRTLQPELGHKVLSSAELAPPPLLHAVHCFQQ